MQPQSLCDLLMRCIFTACFAVGHKGDDSTAASVECPILFYSNMEIQKNIPIFFSGVMHTKCRSSKVHYLVVCGESIIDVLGKSVIQTNKYIGRLYCRTNWLVLCCVYDVRSSCTLCAEICDNNKFSLNAIANVLYIYIYISLITEYIQR